MDKKFVDITDRVAQAPDLDGRMKAFDYMMRQNRGSIIEEGSYGQEPAKTAKIFTQRNRTTEKRNS